MRGQITVQRDRFIRPGTSIRVKRVPDTQVFPGESFGRQARCH